MDADWSDTPAGGQIPEVFLMLEKGGSRLGYQWYNDQQSYPITVLSS